MRSSLLNVKFVGALSTVTVITPNQYSADGCQRGTSHPASPLFPLSSRLFRRVITRRFAVCKKTRVYRPYFFKRRGPQARKGRPPEVAGKTANNCGPARWTGERTVGRRGRRFPWINRDDNWRRTRRARRRRDSATVGRSRDIRLNRATQATSASLASRWSTSRDA